MRGAWADAIVCRRAVVPAIVVCRAECIIFFGLNCIQANCKALLLTGARAGAQGRRALGPP